ncbi:MAG: hypothetical protein M1608_03015 [Candidatus Omnitrophica bacterium]|nr:hypothetical protein [Candidatus Omnitrophota bacterium]
MKPTALFIITGDPRASPRPAEAVRIAAGIGAWQRIDVTIYLRARAVLVLSEFPEELVDADNFDRYLPIVKEWGRQVYVQRGAPELAEIGLAAVAYREISDSELARLTARQDYIMRF